MRSYNSVVRRSPLEAVLSEPPQRSLAAEATHISFFLLGRNSPLPTLLSSLLSIATHKSHHASASKESTMLIWSVLSDLQ